MDQARPRANAGAFLHSDKNRVITILLVSAVMLWALGCAALLNLPAIALFTSRFTARGFVSDADGIVKMYALNTNVTATEIALLRLESLATGMCYPVQYDGYLQWSEEQVSPLCHCLAGKHHEYELNVTRTVGGGVPRTEAELQGDVNGRVLFAWTIRRDCFQGLRPTQYEQLSGWSHNSVIGAILWNTLSTMSVLFVCAAKTDYKRLVPNTYLRAAMEGLLLLWPLLAILWHLKLQGIATIAVCLAYYGVKVFAEARAQSWDLHFSIAFWGQFAFTLPMVIVSSNVVTQQRDGLFNMLIYFICVVVPLNALAGDYCMAVAVKAGKANLDGSYKAMLFFSWLANALLILAVLNISSSAFPSNPFSNTASGVWAVTSIVCIIPVLQPRSVWKSEDRWSRLIVNRYSLDLAARIIFTIAVVIDLSATRNVDNLVIGPHP